MRIPAGWYPQLDGLRSFGRRFAGDGTKGWGALTLMVLIGAFSYGFRGAWVMLGLFALVVGVITTVRGQVGWARLKSRGAGGLLLFAGLLITLVAGLARTPPADADSATIVAPTVATSQIPATSTSRPAPATVVTSRATAPAGSVGPGRTGIRVGTAFTPSTHTPAPARRTAPARAPAPAPVPPPRPASAPATTPAPTTTTPTRPAPTPSPTTTTTAATTTTARSTTTLSTPGTTRLP